MPAPSTLFSASGCPFAHRVRALVSHLDHPIELREVDLSRPDPELIRRSPTGKVPLWVQPDDSVLYESQVITEYLAEVHGWSGWHADPAIRAQQRLVVRQFDEVVLPVLYYRDIRGWPFRWRRRKEARAIAGWLTLLQAVLPHTEPRSHLGLALAPFWMRFVWLNFLIGAEGELRAHDGVGEWLDAAVALPEVQATRPDPEPYIRRYRRMRSIGLGSFTAASGLVLVMWLVVWLWA